MRGLWSDRTISQALDERLGVIEYFTQRKIAVAVAVGLGIERVDEAKGEEAVFRGFAEL